MTRIERSIVIDAPPEDVFERLIAWDGLRRWSTITVDHTGPGRCTGVGDTFQQTIRLAGVDLRTDWEVTEHNFPRTVEYHATGPGDARLRMRQHVSPAARGSRLDLEIDYQLPGGVLGKAVGRLYATRRNERDAEHTLANLKDILEKRPA